MRRNAFIAFVLTTTVILSQCLGPKKLTYTFPPEVKDSLLRLYTAKCAAGYNLYQAYCADCHKERSSTGIPYFTKAQVTSYALKNPSMPKAKHEVMRKLSQDDFNTIIFFLYYLNNDDPKKKAMN